MSILQIALPCPLYQLFEYLPPRSEVVQVYQPGTRFTVPFGRRRLVGVLMHIVPQASFEGTLRNAESCLDDRPILSKNLLALIDWISQYYQLPIGEVVSLALPKKLREGAVFFEQQQWMKTTNAATEFIATSRARVKVELLQYLQIAQTIENIALYFPSWSQHKAALLKQNLIESFSTTSIPTPNLHWQSPVTKMTAFQLHLAQETAVEAICKQQNTYAPFLLEGVTGSGKTAVYIECARYYLQKGQQVLVIVPEIGLTPQLVERFQSYLGIEIGVLHSALTDQQRLLTYRQGYLQQCGLVIGTRSALFTHLPRLGLIIIDEEHDTSLRQQEGLQYSARDAAIKYAQICQIPIVLGSATPSLESLHNVHVGKYCHLQLTQRAVGQLPTITVVDMNQQQIVSGISTALLNAITLTLNKGEQVMLLLNRRGFAPVVYCQHCQHILDCHQCDGHLTYHAAHKRLHCHHCGITKKLPQQCPKCYQSELTLLGVGTQRIEQQLKEYFPEVGLIRVDRDNLSATQTFATLCDKIRQKEYQIILGTQMIAKGHDFPSVTLVGIINCDAALYSTDFRAEEQLAQLMTQMAGRAGRDQYAGHVLIQTHFPQHPLFTELFIQGYSRYAHQLLASRQQAKLPPFIRQAMIWVEGKQQVTLVQQFEKCLEQVLHQHQAIFSTLELTPVIPATLARKQGWYRSYVLVQAKHYKLLSQALTIFRSELQTLPRQLRWRIVIDPYEFY